MAKKKRGVVSQASNSVIAWAFIVGALVAILLGLFGTSSAVAPYAGVLVTILVLAGLIVGLFNITPEETNNYLLAAVSIVVVSALADDSLSLIQGVGPYLQNMFVYLMAFIVPAVLVVGLKAIYYVSKD